MRAGRYRTLSTEEGKGVDALERFQQPPLRAGINHSKSDQNGRFSKSFFLLLFREEIRIVSTLRKVSRKNARLLWHSVALAKKDAYFLRKNGTGEGTRTPTLVKEADFESAASTNSATPAPRARILVVCCSFVNKFVSAKLFLSAYLLWRAAQ